MVVVVIKRFRSRDFKSCQRNTEIKPEHTFTFKINTSVSIPAVLIKRDRIMPSYGHPLAFGYSIHSVEWPHQISAKMCPTLDIFCLTVVNGMCHYARVFLFYSCHSQLSPIPWSTSSSNLKVNFVHTKQLLFLSLSFVLTCISSLCSDSHILYQDTISKCQ